MIDYELEYWEARVAWEFEDAGIFVTRQQAKDLAHWLRWGAA